MAKRLFDKQQPEFEGRRAEREAAISKIENEFRTTVSLQGIY